MIRGLLLALALALAPCVASAQLLLVGAGPGARSSAALPVPTFNWAAQANGSVSTTSLATTKGANTITVGQLLVAGIQLPDNSGVDHSVQCPTGFTAFSWSPSYDTNTNWAWCWKIAGAGDTGGAFTFNWTTNVTQVPQATLLDFSGHNATTPIDVTANGQNTQAAPTVTTTGANRLLVSCSGMPGSSPTVTSQPSGMSAVFSGTASSGANARTACASETFATAGATGARTWVWSQNNGAQSTNFAIAP